MCELVVYRLWIVFDDKYIDNNSDTIIILIAVYIKYGAVVGGVCINCQWCVCVVEYNI